MAASNRLSDIDSALAELETVYQELAAALSSLNPRCEMSGRCCNFLHGQYILFVSELEAERVRRATRAPEPWALKPSGECPFLEDKKCSIHLDRPLGCRTFFCDPTYRPNEAEVYQKFRQRIAEISDRHAIPWNYRPLHGVSGWEVLRAGKAKSGTVDASPFPILPHLPECSGVEAPDR